jgi:hypothetical protein
MFRLEAMGGGVGGDADKARSRERESSVFAPPFPTVYGKSVECRTDKLFVDEMYQGLVAGDYVYLNNQTMGVGGERSQYEVLGVGPLATQVTRDIRGMQSGDAHLGLWLIDRNALDTFGEPNKHFNKAIYFGKQQADVLTKVR